MLLTEANCFPDKVEIFFIFQSSINAGKDLGAAVPDAPVNHADLDVVRPPRVQHKLHQGTPGVPLARSCVPQLKYNSEIITKCIFS